MIEDELRSLLTERARDLPGNPSRVTEVRSRIRGIRRRRIAGSALGLVLLALAGLAVLRLPGTNESLPPAVPAPPWFDDIGRPTVPGYSQVRGEPDVTEPQEHLIVAGYGTASTRHLIVARCQRPAAGTVRNNNGPRFEVDCSRRVDDHFEGVTALDPAQTALLLGTVPSGRPNVWFEPGSEGSWAIAILRANAPESLPPHTDGGSPLLADGTADCDPLGRTMTDGKVATYVSKRQLAALDLRPGDRVPLTIRSVGRDTDQWRVFPPN